MYKEFRNSSKLKDTVKCEPVSDKIGLVRGRNQTKVSGGAPSDTLLLTCYNLSEEREQE